jgi:precorrin-6A/cobalt-precorrin-6A reductase
VLLLGGTAEARELAERLHGVPGLEVVTSYAGRVRDVAPPAGGSRVGGFGGADGLRAWLATHTPVVVVDATHPFARLISEHAAQAAPAAGVPLLRLERPGWVEGPADRWHRVPDVAAAAALVPDLGTRPLLTTGRQELRPFVEHPACAALPLLIRCVEPPDEPLPPTARVILDRGPYSAAVERALLLEHRVDVVVTKDSGGGATRAKLDAARELGLPVVLIDRPPPPAAAATVPTVPDVNTALTWILTHP